MRRVLLAAATSAALLVARGAAAADDNQVSKQAEQDRTDQPPWRRAPQFRISIDTGVCDFRRDLRTEVGPAYGATLGFFPTDFAGIEAHYQGSSNAVTPPQAGGVVGQAGFSRVETNGLVGQLRVGAPLVVEPFVFGGAGWLRVQQKGLSGTADRITDSLAIPVGGGVDVHVSRRFEVGGRFTYDFLTSNSVAGARNVNFWAATLAVGATIE